jgi:serine/threonine protein kinase
MQPSNLLLNSECLLKLADFGLARSLADCNADGGKHHAQLTDYVATRWYRAPEILLGSHQYTFGVDMWSCGCILGELLTGRPIFPGKSTMNQLDLIFSVTGVPSKEEAARIGSPYCSQMIDMSRARLASIAAAAAAVAAACAGRLLCDRPVFLVPLLSVYLASMSNASVWPACLHALAMQWLRSVMPHVPVVGATCTHAQLSWPGFADISSCSTHIDEAVASRFVDMGEGEAGPGIAGPASSAVSSKLNAGAAVSCPATPCVLMVRVLQSTHPVHK